MQKDRNCRQDGGREAVSAPAPSSKSRARTRRDRPAAAARSQDRAVTRADAAAGGGAPVGGGGSADDVSPGRPPDPFAWLQDRDDPRVRRWLEAENRRTEEALAHTEGLRRQLFDEMVGRIRETDVSAPIRLEGWLYYRRTEAGKQYPIFCRIPAPPAGTPVPPPEALREPPPEERVLVDGNQLAEGHGYFHLPFARPAPGGRLLAYACDTTGSERYTIAVRDLEADRTLPDRIHGAADSLAWGNDGLSIYYLRLDEKRRPYEVRRHELGTDAEDDEVLHREEDEAFFAYLRKSRSRRFVVLQLVSKTTTEVRILDADRPGARFRTFRPRMAGVEYDVAHQGERFLVRTNEGALEFRLLSAPAPRPVGPDTEPAEPAQPSGDPETPLFPAGGAVPSSWREVVPGREDVKLEAVEPFRGHIALMERAEAARHVRILPPDAGLAPRGDDEGRASDAGPAGGDADGASDAGPAGGDADGARVTDHRVELPESVYALGVGDNLEYDAPTFRLVLSSPVVPETVYDYHAAERRLEVVKRDEVPDHDPERYVARRIHATAADGTSVPLSLFHPRDLERDGSAPCLLSGYGAYGMSYDPGFNQHALSLLERGFVYAVAHVRGGGELGEAWYRAAKLLSKRTTFTDFIACSEHLIAEGYTSPRRLAIRGRSAGGLLLGAVINMRPDLYRAVVAGVPFVDVLNTMLDPHVPLTITEYEEWGNPAATDVRDYIASYSPYENIAARDYPHILATAGLHDPRVQYWEPAKWVARLRERKTDDNLLLLKTDLGAGHAGPSGRYDYLRDLAFEYAFLLDVLGVDAGDG